MKKSSRELMDAFNREILRLGLDPLAGPRIMVAGTEEGLAQHLEYVRTLEPGATWRDVYPDVAEEFFLDEDYSLDTPFESYGSFDYQNPPAGAAIMVGFSKTGAGAKFDAIVARAKEAGFKMFGAGIQFSRDPVTRETLGESSWGIIVVELGTPVTVVDEFVDWLREQPDVVHSRPYRDDESTFLTP